MRWRKLGALFSAAGQRPWMQSHCSMPFAEPLDGDVCRIWFAPRDAQNRSHAGWLDIDLKAPQTILRLAENPVLAPGPAGRFDHSGAAGSCLVQNGAERRLYYIGWSRGGPTPFHIAIGLAMSADPAQDPKQDFSRYGAAPVLDRSADDPIFVSTPFVIDTGSGWRMWYLSVTDWPASLQQPNYNLRQAVSADGIRWETDPIPCIDVAHPTEIAIARPSVIPDKDIWRMWYSHRGTDYPYRIGYAESRDGLRWTRRDAEAGITVSESGWDSEMTAYPFVFDHNGSRYMLYAGNGFGRGGMGLAVLEQD